MKEFSAYYQSVSDSLVSNYHYSEVEANFLVNGYSSVMERIGLFDNPSMWASKLDEAMKSHITPDMWHAVL